MRIEEINHHFLFSGRFRLRLVAHFCLGGLKKKELYLFILFLNDCLNILQINITNYVKNIIFLMYGIKLFCK